MASGVECVCCKEINQVGNVTAATEGVECIIHHSGFQTVCLDPWVLRTAYYGENAVEGATNE